MNKIFILSSYCFSLFFVSHEYLYAASKEVNEVASGLNVFSKAFGDAALNIKKAYDQIDPNSVKTSSAIAGGDARTKMLEAKLQAVVDSVKQWMMTDSNTKQEALQTLQRNTEIIGKEVDKAKRQLEQANNSANNAPVADRTKFNNEIQASANAVSANSQYYMATKTRFDYEKKYKEMIDERNKRLDMVQKIDDPQTLKELLSDSTDIGSKKYGTQLGDYTNTDIKLRNNLPQQTAQNVYTQNNNIPYTQNASTFNSYNGTTYDNRTNNSSQLVWYNVQEPNVPQSRPSSWHTPQPLSNIQTQYAPQNQYGIQPQYDAQTAYSTGNGQFVNSRNNYVSQYSNQDNWGQNFSQPSNYMNSSINNNNFTRTSNMPNSPNQLVNNSQNRANKNPGFRQNSLADVLAPLSYDSN